MVKRKLTVACERKTFLTCWEKLEGKKRVETEVKEFVILIPLNDGYLMDEYVKETEH